MFELLREHFFELASIMADRDSGSSYCCTPHPIWLAYSRVQTRKAVFLSIGSLF